MHTNWTLTTCIKIVGTLILLTCDQSINPSFVFGIASTGESVVSWELGICKLKREKSKTKCLTRQEIGA